MKLASSLIACSLISMLAADSGSSSKKSKSEESNPQMCAPNSMCDSVGFEIYGTLLYMQPNGSDLYYAVEAVGLDPDIAVPAVSPNWYVKEIKPDYHFGFEVGAGLLFRNTDMSLTADWERLHGHDSSSFQASSAAGFMVGPFFDIGPNSASYKIAKGKLTSHFDKVDLEFGKRFCFFDRLYLNFRAGAGFARIKQSVNSSYSNVAGDITRKVKTSSKFIGGGPEIGLDYDCRLVSELFFTGATDVGLFVGQMSNTNTFQSTTPVLAELGVPQPNNQATNVPNRTQLVPGFEQRLGFSYVAAWDCFKAAFEIGYRCQVYLNGVQSVDMTAPQVLPAIEGIAPQVGVFAVGFERTLSNYILSGPYATVNFKF